MSPAGTREHPVTVGKPASRATSNLLADAATVVVAVRPTGAVVAAAAVAAAKVVVVEIEAAAGEKGDE
jgi:hypothetical protein